MKKSRNHSLASFLFFFQSLQNDLEAEQVKVNSLTHMVVIVDENSGESATAVLEDQLQVRTLAGRTALKMLYPLPPPAHPTPNK